MDEITTVPIIPTVDDYEQFLRQRIDAIHRAAQDEMRPFVKELVRLEMMKPPAPFFITKEQAETLGLPRRG